MNGNVKKILGWFAIGFVVWFLLTAPEESADAVDKAFSSTISAFENVGTFFRELSE